MFTNPKKNTAQQIYASMGVGSGDNWDELAIGQEEKIRSVLAQSSTGVHTATQQVAEAGLVDEEFNVMVRGTMNDLRDYASRFQSLVARRDGRTGPTKNDADYTEYLSLGLEYVALDQEMAVVLPVGLFNMAGYQARAMRAIEAANAANVNVVTDVVAKDIPTEATPVQA